jgi:hypothetical protein
MFLQLIQIAELYGFALSNLYSDKYIKNRQLIQAQRQNSVIAFLSKSILLDKKNKNKNMIKLEDEQEWAEAQTQREYSTPTESRGQGDG